MNNYYWVTGVDGHGAATTAGPYMSQQEALDATAHLRQTQVHLLHTRQHDKARRILKARLRGGGGQDEGSAMASDQPMASRSSLISRFRDMVRPARNDEDMEDSY